jgi:uncharacterized membrane protein YfcA
MGTFLTSVAGVVFYMAIAPFFPGQSVSPDWMLGMLFGLGGIVGMYCGARCQKFVPLTPLNGCSVSSLWERRSSMFWNIVGSSQV